MSRRKVKVARHEIAGFDVEVSRKQMKTIRLKVCPPGGDVKVSAPYHVHFSAIESLVQNQRAWIENQQVLLRAQPLPDVASYVEGERHSVFGRLYELVLVGYDVKGGIRVNHDAQTIEFNSGITSARRAMLLESWYRERLLEELSVLVPKWQPVVGKTVREYRIRKMKTRWGSCNIQKARIWLNLELAKKPIECLEYVVVHEMTHLHERYHNRRFYSFMDDFLPNWRNIRQLINC